MAGPVIRIQTTSAHSSPESGAPGSTSPVSNRRLCAASLISSAASPPLAHTSTPPSPFPPQRWRARRMNRLHAGQHEKGRPTRSGPCRGAVPWRGQNDCDVDKWAAECTHSGRASRRRRGSSAARRVVLGLIPRGEFLPLHTHKTLRTQLIVRELPSNLACSQCEERIRNKNQFLSS